MNKLANGLYYTDEDILVLYRESKNKKLELDLLADMNCCTPEEIKKALIRAGIDGRELPRNIKNKNNKSDSSDVQNTVNNEPVVINEEKTDTKEENTDINKDETISIENNTNNTYNLVQSCMMDALNCYRVSLIERRLFINNRISECEGEISSLSKELEETNQKLALLDMVTSLK